MSIRQQMSLVPSASPFQASGMDEGPQCPLPAPPWPSGFQWYLQMALATLLTPSRDAGPLNLSSSPEVQASVSFQGCGGHSQEGVRPPGWCLPRCQGLSPLNSSRKHSGHCICPPLPPPPSCLSAAYLMDLLSTHFRTGQDWGSDWA